MNSDLESLLFLELTAWRPPEDPCPTAEDLAAWIDEQQGELESHLDVCASCRADVLVVTAARLQTPPCASLPRERPRRRRGLSRGRNHLGSKRQRVSSKRQRVSSKRQRVSSKHAQVGSRRSQPPQVLGLQLAAAAAVLLLLVFALRGDRAAAPTHHSAQLTAPAHNPRLVSSLQAESTTPSPAAQDRRVAGTTASAREDWRPAGLDTLGMLLEESLHDDPDDVDVEDEDVGFEPSHAPLPPAPAASPAESQTVAPDAAAPAGVAAAETAPSAGRTVDTSGLRVRRANRIGWSDLERDPQLRPGDRLRGSPAGGVIGLASAQIYVAPRARLTVDEDLSLALVRGQVLVFGTGDVRTPAGQVTVHGEALVAVSRDRLGLRVIQGQAACAHGSGLLLLGSGEDLLATSRQAGAPRPAPLANGSSLPGWTRALPPAPTSLPDVGSVPTAPTATGARPLGDPTPAGARDSGGGTHGRGRGEASGRGDRGGRGSTSGPRGSRPNTRGGARPSGQGGRGHHGARGRR